MPAEVIKYHLEKEYLEQNEKAKTQGWLSGAVA